MDQSSYKRLAGAKNVLIGHERPSTTLFGLWLRSERHRLQMKTREFTLFIGIADQSSSLLTSWERGTSHPSEKAIKIIAEPLGLSINDLREKITASIGYLLETGEGGIDELIKSQGKVIDKDEILHKIRTDNSYRGCGPRATSRTPQRKFVCSVSIPYDVTRWYAAIAEREERSFSSVLRMRLVKYYEEQTGLISLD